MIVIQVWWAILYSGLERSCCTLPFQCNSIKRMSSAGYQVGGQFSFGNWDNQFSGSLAVLCVIYLFIYADLHVLEKERRGMK